MMDLFTLVYIPFQIFLFFPVLTLIPAAAFLLAFIRQKRVILLAVSAAWLAYGSWEWYMHEWSKTVVAPIRIDLLLIVPVIYVLTAFGIYYSLKKSNH